MELEFMFDPEKDQVVVMALDQRPPIILRNIGALNMQEWSNLEEKVLDMKGKLEAIPTNPHFRAAYLAHIDAEEKARLSEVAMSCKS